MSRLLLAASVFFIMTSGPGCVRRTLTVRTQPEGATVWINDEEVGKSPASVDFTWYGDYDIICRKEGCQTLETHHRVNAPWYQIPPIDFLAEVLTPWTYEDHQSVEFQMEPEQLPGRTELIQRARELREQALFGEK
jgi:hypothetical protein